MQAWYRHALEPIAATTGAPHSSGFWKERSTADAIQHCCNVLRTRQSPTWILAGDSQACFDASSHAWRLAHIPMDNGILRKWLEAGWMDQGPLDPTEAGTPQGSIASPVLATLALDGLERALRRHVPRPKRGDNAKVHVVRYCEDWIISQEGTRSHQGEQNHPGGSIDRSAQPPAAGLGQRSPPCGESSHLCQERPCHLPSPVVLGQASTSAQAARMDSPPGLSPRGRQPLGVLWPDAYQPWHNPGLAVDAIGLHAHHTAHQSES
jgi:Reverse transcriptase (RNA-dependent DNA polymerase)